MFVAFPAGNLTTDQCITLASQIAFRNRLADIARTPLMNIKLFHKTLEADIHTSCFASSLIIKRNLERAVTAMTDAYEPKDSDNILGVHIGVLTNLLYATINNDFESRFIISLGHFLQCASDLLQHIFDVVTNSPNSSDATGFDTSIITKNKGTCYQIQCILEFLRQSLAFSPESKLLSIFDEMDLVIDIITDAPFN